MAGKLFALLVGIDHYLSNEAPTLSGCVNDIDRLAAVLQSSGAPPGGTELVLRTLRDAEATRAEIIAAFRAHLGQAGPDDIALFSFSGHGSQGVAPPEFARIEQDLLLETLVCHDSRTPGVRDLADKELAKLIHEVSQSGASVVVILDACHAANGTREPGPGVRRAPVDESPRPLDSFIVDPDELVKLGAAGPSGWTPGRHLLLAACRADEEAKEIWVNARKCGVFSYYLAKTLSEAARDLTYREVFTRTAALVRTRVRDQNPQLEAVRVADFDQIFLGGAGNRSPHFSVTWNDDFGWVVDAGAVHGIPAPDGAETTAFALFPPGTPEDELHDLAGASGRAVVRRVQPGFSAVDLKPTQPDRTQTWTAVVTTSPLVRMPVVLDGDAALLQAARDLLTPSLFVREAADGEAEYGLTATGGGYEIRRLPDGQPVAPRLTGADAAVGSLEHIARWRRVADLGNRSALATTNVKLRIHAWNDEIAALGGDPPELPVDGELRLAYEFRQGAWRPPRIKISLENTGSQALYCSVLVMPETYSIVSGLYPSGRVRLAPGERAWANDDLPLRVSVPDEFARLGVVTLDHIVKLVVSTGDADMTVLDQSDLSQLERPVLNRALDPPLSTLDRLLRRVQLRHFEPEAREPIADWAAGEIKVTVVRPREAVPVPAAGGEAELAPAVVLIGHNALAGASARLTTEDLATREVRGPALPPLLRDSPAAHLVEFLVTGSGMAGPSVLELAVPPGFDHRGVTADEPLVLRAGIPLAEGEELLPIGRLLPLGDARPVDGGAEVRLVRLPAAGPDGVIRVYFRRLTGTPAPPGGLAVAERGPDGVVTYEREPGLIRQRVGAASSIRLFVPGLVGDSRDLPGAEAGELLLTFDHSCPDVEVQTCATALAAALADAGLEPGHGRPLHVVAHSVGGLIARWFIEKAGGAQVVTSLTMLGTPNAGVSWPRLPEWATLALALGLNRLTTMTWPPEALSALLALGRREDPKAGHQLRPDSELLRELAASPDPGVPYLAVAGTASTLAGAVDKQDDGSTTVGRLLDRLRLPGVSDIAALAFLRAPNDLLVSEDSATRLPDGRQPVPVALRADCDHLTYPGLTYPGMAPPP
ncbi:caspase family protein [Paractinoplanes atraurantiacus]|uniref:Caspase domain-containing protein n=1 Tax=Paractinoplanes atraurantiacus TaxID=1036182 RepID=A0A285HTX8_9ACTN|nr:caspase family protein [Actinoplanes atraurantiacus]SNY39083.1 Caspase domain-containing protein [Actinoplanes atraurantiacus]